MNAEYTATISASGRTIYVYNALLPIAPDIEPALCRAASSLAITETTGDSLTIGLLDTTTGYTFCVETEATFTVPAFALVAILPPVGQNSTADNVRTVIDSQLVIWLETANGRAVRSGEGVADHAEIPLCFSASDFTVVTWEGQLYQSPLEKISTC